MSEETTVSQVMEQQTPDTTDTTDRNEASTEEKDFVTAEDQAPERPEWLPEKFKTPEAFAEGYSNLEKKFHQKESDLKAAWDKEIEELAYKDRPASAGDYVLPESIDSEQAPNNELLGWWSKHAWDNGWSQEEFASGIEAFKFSTLSFFSVSKAPEKNSPMKTAAIAPPIIAINFVLDDCVLSFLFCDGSNNMS